jgi:nucleolar protein 15
MSKTLHRNLQAKIAALQGEAIPVSFFVLRVLDHLSHFSSLAGPEWESSDEEQDKTVEVKAGKTKKSIAERKRSKKQSNKKHTEEINEEHGNEEEPTVIYIGHLPNQFEESDLRTFLSQFGNVENSRISRSVKTGGSRGYAFVKFAEADVAQVVAETLQGYFLGQRRLVCHLVQKPDDGMFYDTDKLIIRRKASLAAEKKRRNQNLASASKMKEITSRLVRREKKKRKKLQELGIDYDFPGYESNLIVDEEETEMASKKKKRKEAVDSTSSASSRKRKESVDSTSSASSRKRKDSISSETSATKKSKRKDSIGSVGSNVSLRRSKRNSPGLEAEVVPNTTPQSEKKKKKKSGNRNLSVP